MKLFFSEHKILAGIILLLFLFSLLCQIVVGFLYQNMIKETYNMSSTENKTLKVCKLKFINRYELHKKVANIPVFVDKFIHSIRFGPFSEKMLRHLSGQFLLLSVFAAGIGACRAIIAEETIGEILVYYVLSFVMLYAYFSIVAVVDIKGKKEILKINLIDYLENNISVRIPQSKKEQERLNELEAGEGVKKEAALVLTENKEKSTSKETKQEIEQKYTAIADFAAHKRREEKGNLEPEEVKELGGLLLEFM